MTPLAAQGIKVDGVDGPPMMVERLQKQRRHKEVLQ